MIDIYSELQEQLQHLFAVPSPAITAAMKAAQSPAATAAMKAAQSPAVTAAMKTAQSVSAFSILATTQIPVTAAFSMLSIEAMNRLNGLQADSYKILDELEPVIEYAKENVLDIDMTIDEALQQVTQISSGDLHVELNSKQISLLSFCASALDALQDQDIIFFLYGSLWPFLS